MNKQNNPKPQSKHNIRNLLKKLELAFEEIELFEPQLEPMDQIGEIIRRERKLQKINLRDLADLSGLSVQTLINIEHGKKSVSLGNVEGVLKALGKKLWIQ